MPPTILSKDVHVHEQMPLLQSIVESLVGVRRKPMKPSPRHVLLRREAVGLAQFRHHEGLDVDRREAERGPSNEAHQVPVDEQEVKACGIAHEGFD